jgi:hypothetical protein
MAEPEHIGDTLDEKKGKLENNQPIKGVPNGPCEKCGKDTHDTAGHGKAGGARKGGGRKEHGKNQKTVEREARLEAFRERVGKHADRLFNAQANLATGEQYLFVKVTTGSGKDRKTHTEIVTDPEVIKQYLDDELDNSDDEYYYLSTKPANNMAIDSLLNRAFGTPNKNIDLKSNGQTILDRMDDVDVRRIATAMSEALSGTDDEPTE